MINSNGGDLIQHLDKTMGDDSIRAELLFARGCVNGPGCAADITDNLFQVTTMFRF